MSSRANDSNLSLCDGTRQAIVVAKERSSRRKLACELAKDGYEVIALESVAVLPRIVPMVGGSIRMLVVEGSMMDTLAVVDELRTMGLVCPVSIRSCATRCA